MAMRVREHVFGRICCVVFRAIDYFHELTPLWHHLLVQGLLNSGGILFLVTLTRALTNQEDSKTDMFHNEHSSR